MEMTKIPVGSWIQNWVQFLTSNFENQFQMFSDGLNSTMLFAVQHLLSFSPWICIGMVSALVFLLSYTQIKACIIRTLGTAVGGFLILNLGYWTEAVETIVLVVFSTLIATGIGIPIGILSAHQKWLYRFLRPCLDFMQTIPTFVYLIPALMLFGLGLTPGVIATVIFSISAPIQLTYLGITQTPPELLEVGEAFGATVWQKLFTLELPFASKIIRTGISQCLLLSLSMVVIAALVGADGLGKPVIQALNTVNAAKGFEAGLVIVLIAIFFNQLLNPAASSVPGSPPRGQEAS
jgi:glycine betaine/proline transport system permease protein